MSVWKSRFFMNDRDRIAAAIELYDTNRITQSEIISLVNS